MGVDIKVSGNQVKAMRPKNDLADKWKEGLRYVDAAHRGLYNWLSTATDAQFDKLSFICPSHIRGRLESLRTRCQASRDDIAELYERLYDEEVWTHRRPSKLE